MVGSGQSKVKFEVVDEVTSPFEGIHNLVHYCQILILSFDEPVGFFERDLDEIIHAINK
jgi:hypothetical protein